MTDPTRQGILAAGNFIIDHVKVIDEYPTPEMLATIVSQSRSNGGGPYNLLKDLAKLQAPFPLAALGLTGHDADGDWILADCALSHIDASRLRQTSDAATSYTDAMTVQRGGQRTFFHHRGANARLAPGHFDFSGSQARLFYLGYLMLLDGLDQFDGEGRTGASRVFERARQHGCITCADLVSVNHPGFASIVASSLPWIDILFINEIEAGKVLQRDLRSQDPADARAMEAAAEDLIQLGSRETVVLHFGDGAVAANARQGVFRQGRVRLPVESIAGATGAGDAFAAGYLMAYHQGHSIPECLELAVSAAASSMTAGTPSDGLQPAPAALDFARSHGFLAL
ncbi:MAG TPA: carbohydrate kinase family protein [Verrucomicrobiales bacterium]|nr:carbohydrate kinase family protein [Verrucomicrobiales bacterium]